MHDDSTEEEEMKRQRRMKIMKDMTKKIRSRGRMDAESRWWVAELLAADCEKAWIHPGWEVAMQKWYEWLEKGKRKMGKAKMEEMHQQKVAQMIKSAEGSKRWTPAQDLQAHSMERRCTDPEERRRRI